MYVAGRINRILDGRFLSSTLLTNCGRHNRVLFSHSAEATVSPSSDSTRTSKDGTTLPSKAKRKGEEKWRLALLDKLQTELKHQNRKNAAEQVVRASHANLIRYAINGDYASIISFAHRHLRVVGSQGKLNTNSDQQLAVSLLLTQRCLVRLIENGGTNSSEALSICVSYANLWDGIKFLGPDTRAAAILLYNTLRNWSKSRLTDGNSGEINRIMQSMEEKLKRVAQGFDLAACSLFFPDQDRNMILQCYEELQTTYDISRIPKESDAGYEPSLDLVDPLRDPVPVSDYHGNPYHVDGITKADFLPLFKEHLRLEESTWLRVENFSNSRLPGVTMSAEELLDSWKWMERIQKSIERLIEQRTQYPLKGFLSVVSSSELSAAVLEAAIAVCSQGQNLVPVSSFQHSLTTPVFRLVHRKFVEKLGVDEKRLWTAVFEDYLTYFEDDTVARLHTHRAWWEKCCKRHSVTPDFQSPFSDFHSDARSQLGAFLTEAVLESCLFPGKGERRKAALLPAFNIRNVAIEEESRINENGRVGLSRMVSLNAQMLDLLEKHQFDYILFPTHELPMTVPPRPWIDRGMGGPEYMRSEQVLRSLSDYKRIDVNKDMKSRLQNKAQARPVFDALNQLGATPWKINDPMLDVLCQVFAMSDDATQSSLLNTLSVPQKADTVVVPHVSDVFASQSPGEAVSKEEWRKYYSLKAEAEKKRNELNSLWYWMMYRIVLARHFRGRILFFPHNMDFRGRVYPISPYLSHMGDDVNRCILKFAKGKRLGENGLSWLKLHCINLTGKMKRQSVADRLVAADELMTEMVDSADRPLNGNGWWLKSEEPWQTLAACMEIRDALAFKGDTADFVSHLAVHQDGSCNGLQHYAALGRDREGGGEVNLLPSEIPSDVYSSVAARVEQKRLEDEERGEYMELAKKLRVVMPQVVPRKVIKQTVMTTVYGVTMYGAVLQIKRQLKDLGINNDDTANFASYLAKTTFASLNDAFTSSMQLKDWFRDCAKGAGELLRTVEWVTPLGLPVVQPYLRAKDVKGRLILAPVPSKQIDAFPPNLVHSLDSTHMMLTSLDCSRRGVTFAAVHDCFWTHASSVDEMNRVCRKQFVLLHSQPIVTQCSQWMLERYLPPALTSKMDEADRKRYQGIFSPQVEPGKLDITDVMQSIYFFS